MKQPATNKPKDGVKDSGNIGVEDHIKIFDPSTKELYVDKR